MAWYPDWVVALEQVSKGVKYAEVSRRDAENIIGEIKKMQAKIADLEDQVRRAAIVDSLVEWQRAERAKR